MAAHENRFLNGNPLDWLLEESEPSLRYLTHRDILKTEVPDPAREITVTPEIRQIIHAPSGLLGNPNNFDIFYKGTMWCFAEAVERGLDRRSPLVEKTVASIFNTALTSDGGFSLNWNPRVPVACRTGDMLRYLIRAGYYDDRIVRGIEWILRRQRHDGGWLHCPLAGTCDQLRLLLLNRPGNGLKREGDPSVTSCFYASIACAHALAEYRPLATPGSLEGPIRAAAEFFLRRSLFRTSGNRVIRPKGGWNRDFRLLGYPVLSQYDILHGLIFIARAGLINDPRCGEAFNLVISRQNPDGTWNLESAATGMLMGDHRKRLIGRRSKWVTLNVLRLLSLGGVVISEQVPSGNT